MRPGKQVCPACGPTRKNKRDRSLSVSRVEGGIVWFCHNCQDRDLRAMALHQRHKEWIEARGISADLAEKFGLETVQKSTARRGWRFPTSNGAGGEPQVSADLRKAPPDGPGRQA
jgi:hypothetical protein